MVSGFRGFGKEMTTPCTQTERMQRIEAKLDRVVDRLGHPGDPLTGEPAQGLVAIVLDQRSVNARVTALEANDANAAIRRKAIVTNAARIVLPLLLGVGLAKADAMIGIAMALVK